MKLRNICLLFFSLVGMSSFAQLNGDGYYRVQNCYTTRYVYVMDDYGKINTSVGSADLDAISLKGGDADTRNYDPASVLYVRKVSGSSYNLASQGTSVYEIIQHNLNINSDTYENTTVYTCSATQAGVTLYLIDPTFQKVSRYPMAKATTSKSAPKYPTQRNWFIKPINSDSDEDYFGIKPETEAIDGKYYRSFYAAFPFKLKSSGMKAFYINKIDGDNAEMVEFESDATIPSSTPVIIECSSDDPSNNRIDIIKGSVSAISDDILTGVYFNHSNDGITNANFIVSNDHIKRTAYDASTMRVLGKKADGTLGFVTSSTLEYIPANTAYLPVTAGSSSELNMVNSASGIKTITADEQAATQGVYTLQGVKVAADASNIDNLSKGVYIVGGKKVLVK